MDKDERPLGEILVDHGILTADDVKVALSRAKAAGRLLGDELLLEGRIHERDLFRALGEQRGLDMAQFDELFDGLDRTLVDKVPRTYLEHTRIVPLQMKSRLLKVAVARPDAPYHDLARALDAIDVQARIITPSDFRRFWSIYDLGEHEAVALDHVDDDVLGREDSGEKKRLVALFEAILIDAISSRASDIHFERYKDLVRLRYRVDGRMHDIKRFELSTYELRGIVNVIKINADLDITERRLPQGGRIRKRTNDAVFDLRIQTQPSLHGENVIIRLLRQEAGTLSIEELGFPDDEADRFRRLLGSPQGLVLVVGPTGSGKSTTLYSGLQVLATDATRKVISVEDPVEYSIDGIQQCQTRPEIGFSFAQAMRAFVREDPDVILVGEIRDSETALEAIRASQTGHLVLSTLHCNDTVDAVQRLLDLDMHPNSIASELVAVVSQRLVRRICTECKGPAEPDPEILAELFPGHPPEHFQCFEGKGCQACDGHGTRGRVASIEFLRVGARIRNGISRGLTVDELRAIAFESGLKPIRNHLIELVLKGVTPLSEIPRTLSIEQMAPAEELLHRIES
jgi:type IV pilus assembly protein PilB